MSAFRAVAFFESLPVTVCTVVVVLGLALVVALRLGRHSVVDTVWGIGFAAIALTAWVMSRGEGDDSRRLIVALLTVVWGLRLATHIGLRSRGHGEDPRYAELLSGATGDRTLFAVRRIYLTQGVVMWFVSLPVQVAMFETPGLGVVEWLGAALWLVGLTFETVGDWQLTRFRNDSGSEGRVLDSGLWRFTRHPNYFGDATAWWGLSLIAFGAWPGILTVLSPVLMTWLLAKGTGKPLLEKDIGRRRPGYADYVRRTSGFFPLPPRRS
jgi:steroid 5-alpha reductase family enzyme